MKSESANHDSRIRLSLQEQYRASLKTRSLRPWEWLSIRLSGVFLVVFVFAHLWLLHYAGTADVTFREVSVKLRSPLYLFLDLGLLALALYHGLMGLIRVVGDLGVLGVRGERVLRWVSLVVGLTSLVLGYRILLAFFEK